MPPALRAASIGGALAALLGAAPAHAQVSIEWVAIGNPFNAPDGTGHGSLTSRYRIARYETTKTEYVAFLNAVAADDTNGLYFPVPAVVSGIDRLGSPGSYSYVVLPGREDDPVNFVTFWDAVRFANWMHNGQPSGAQDMSTTEGGAYTLTPAAIAANTVARNPGARFFVPSEDEWYKAAYYDDLTHVYYDYPAGTDAQTTCSDIPWPDPNHANCDFLSKYELPVGSFPGSPSPYGTSDQGGNVFEWNEQVELIDRRQLRGGSFGFWDASYLSASVSVDSPPVAHVDNFGFRLAAAATPPPVPSAGALGIAALSSLLGLSGARAARCRCAG